LVVALGDDPWRILVVTWGTLTLGPWVKYVGDEVDGSHEQIDIAERMQAMHNTEEGFPHG
jgi:hypothetical protein